MAYSRRPRVIQDFGFGFQSANQAHDNEQALRDALEVEHEADEGGQLGTGISFHGRHLHVTIPKGIGHVQVQTFLPINGGTTSVAASLILKDARTGRGLLYVTRRGVGVYEVGLGTDAHDSNAWVEAHPVVPDETVVRRCESRVEAGWPPTFGNVACVVTCFELVSGAFVEADFDFMLAFLSE